MIPQRAKGPKLADKEGLNVEAARRELQEKGIISTEGVQKVLTAALRDISKAWEQGEVTELYRTDFLVGNDESRVVRCGHPLPQLPPPPKPTRLFGQGTFLSCDNYPRTN